MWGRNLFSAPLLSGLVFQIYQKHDGSEIGELLWKSYTLRSALIFMQGVVSGVFCIFLTFLYMLMRPFTALTLIFFSIVMVSSFLDIAYLSTWKGLERWSFLSCTIEPWTTEVHWSLHFQPFTALHWILFFSSRSQHAYYLC